MLISAKSRIGKKYNEVIIINVLPGNKNRRCVVKCSCGKVFKPFLQNVVRGQTKSCGKHERQKSEKALLRIFHPAEYAVWLRNRKQFPKAWNKSFKVFLDVVGTKPNPRFVWDGKTWSKRKSKKSRLITFQNQTLTMSEWGRVLGRTREGVRQRLLRLPLERALKPKIHN
jgi:hypothetical protein